jgi:hypothetical protein
LHRFCAAGLLVTFCAAFAIASLAQQSPKPASAAAQTAAAPQFPAAGTKLNPAYLEEFPSPDQVMANLKGSDAKDTLNRQLGAFEYFKQMIQDLAGDRYFKSGFMPDEARLWGAYNLAYNNLAKPLNFPIDGYFPRPDFAQQLFATFQMTSVQKLLQSQDAQFAAAQKARQQQPTGSNPAPTTGGAPAPSGVTPLQPSTDPATLAARRCVELGGTMGKCTMQGLSAGLNQFIGFDLSALDPNVHGLVIFGSYQIPNGTVVAFTDTNVVISGCGKLAGGTHLYTVQPFGSQYAIKIANQPQTLLVGIGADGKLVGPAAQVITGTQITGYTYRAQKDPVTGGPVKGTKHDEVPTYGPLTQNCAIGTLPPGPPQDPTPISANPDGAIISALGSLLTGTTPGSGAPTIPPGPRYVGVYTNGSDFRIQFQDANAVIDCKQAHVMVPYDVGLKGGVASVNVKNGATPFTVTPTASGTLTGPASVTVNGKLMTGLTADTQPVLTPTSASCSASSLALAKTGK